MNTIGNKLRVTVFGQSHAPFIGATAEGLPVGMKVDEQAVTAFLARRKSTGTGGQTARLEADTPRVLCGIREGVICADTVTAVFENVDTDSTAYDASLPRPGHADWAARLKYGAAADLRGGGAFSGRMTLPLCWAGALCLQLLAQRGIIVSAAILSVGGETDPARFDALIAETAARGDSVGGEIALSAHGVPGGLGEPMFGGVENRLAAALFGIPAVKGVIFGDVRPFGSENNDAYGIRGGRVTPLSNHAGGILGGITTGAELTARVLIKPVPSISLPQRTVDLNTMKETELRIRGRHDACILPRALPCAEAVTAIVLCDLLLGG